MAEGSCTFDVKSFAPPDTLSGSKVIYKTEAGAVVRQRGVAADMLSVAVSSRVDDRRIKVLDCFVTKSLVVSTYSNYIIFNFCFSPPITKNY